MGEDSPVFDGLFDYIRSYCSGSIGGACRLNTPVTVDALDLSVRRNGDIAYSIRCTEYRFVV